MWKTIHELHAHAMTLFAAVRDDGRRVAEARLTHALSEMYLAGYNEAIRDMGDILTRAADPPAAPRRVVIRGPERAQ